MTGPEEIRRFDALEGIAPRILDALSSRTIIEDWDDDLAKRVILEALDVELSGRNITLAAPSLLTNFSPVELVKRCPDLFSASGLVSMDFRTIYFDLSTFRSAVHQFGEDRRA